MKYFLVGTVNALVFGASVSEKDAKSIFRNTRANQGSFEEILDQPDVTRECYEETCTFQELLEAVPERAAADQIWDKLTRSCKALKPCGPHSTGCKTVWNDYYCSCEEGYFGKNCDQTTSENEPVKQAKSDHDVSNAGFKVSCGEGSMAVTLLNANSKMKNSYQFRPVNVQKLKSHQCDNAENKTLHFNNADTISMDLDDSCFVVANSDENYLYYTFEFFMPPKLDEDHDQVVTDWGSFWLATCKYDRVKFVNVENGNSVVPVLDFDGKEKTDRGYDYSDHGEDVQEGDFQLEMRIAGSSAYTYFYGDGDFPLNFDLNQRVFTEVKFADDSKNFLSLKTKNCWATPDLRGSRVGPFKKPKNLRIGLAL